MNRIMILGCSGSGKSTLAQKLGCIYNLPVIHLDAYYWKPNWEPRLKDEWDQMVKDFARKEQWIIDGNYSRTIDIRLDRADLIVYLDMPRRLCMYRIFKRRLMYHNKTRPDLNEGCPEKIDMEFVKWVWNYKKRSRTKILHKLELVKHKKKVIIVHTPKQVEQLIQQLKTHYAY